MDAFNSRTREELIREILDLRQQLDVFKKSGDAGGVTTSQEGQRLQQAYEMLNKLSAQVPGVIYQYRLFPDGRSCFPYSSAGMWDIYEVTSEEVREDATPVFGRLHPDDYEYIAETIMESARNQTFYHSEFRVILPGSGVRWRMCNAKPELLEDGSTLWHGIIMDITDKKLLEAELIRAKEKAEESDRLKSAFLANMSHEIRTPMNGILGFASLLKEPGLSGEQQKQYISLIERSGDRMLSIINDLLDIARIESGLMKVDYSYSNINEQLDYIFTFFKPECEKKGIRCSLDKYLTDNVAIIKTDREKLYAILTNLFKNAIKYTRKGSIHMGYTLQNGMVKFYLKDTGMGIPDNRKEAIFDRFVQGDISDKEALQGAGLGLSITKAYVEMLGGSIWVESIVGQGSVFYFTLPYESGYTSDVTPVQPEISPEQRTERSNLKILVVEDDETSDYLLSMSLNHMPCTLLHAANGREAVDLFRLHSDIDLILMDIRMPEMDGYEATRIIRETDKDVIIIAQTAFALVGDKEKIIESGFNDYIAKPLRKERLVALIHKYF